MRRLTEMSVFILTLLCSVAAFGLRCGNDLVMLGDTAARIEHICGAPTSKVTSFEEKRIINNREVIVSQGEKWTYNFGSQDFLYVLSFVNDKLSAVDTDGYGY